VTNLNYALRSEINLQSGESEVSEELGRLRRLHFSMFHTLAQSSQRK